MAEKVGDIYYDVTVETGRMIDAQREIERRARETASSLESMGGGARAAERSFRDAGTAAQDAGGRFRDAAGRLREANGQFVKTGEAASGAAGGMNQASSASSILAGRLTPVAIAVKVLASAFALVKTAQMADEMRLLAARVEVAAGSMQAGAEAMRALEEISRRTQTSMEGNVEVFARLNQSMIQMGGTQSDTLQLTELLGKAIKVSGASAIEAKAAMLQFGQALGSGKLAGDELRSLMETAPYLMRQLADGIGVPVGALKKLGEEGKLTSDVVVNALGKAADQIDQDFQKFPQTIDAAMTVAGDAAKRAAEKFDDMTGTSAVLAGATKGLGTVLDKLAEQFSSGTTEADKLGRSTLIKSWAEDTAAVLTYVVDAADFVVRGFKQMGTGLGGLAAAAGAAASGELTQARNILGMMADDIKAIGGAKLSGAKMREQFQFAKDFVGPQAPANLGYTPSKLKAPKGDDDKKPDGRKKQPIDSEKYLAGLSAKVAQDEWQRISIIEQEALREAEENMKKRGMSAADYEKARTLILAAGARERQELMARETQDYLSEMSRKYSQEQDIAKRKEQGIKAAREAIAGANPIEAVRLEEEQKLAVLEAYRVLDLENTRLYEDAKAAIKQQSAEKLAKIAEESANKELEAQSKTLQGYGQLFDGVAGMTKSFAGEQSGIYRAMFAVSKAFAIAESIIKIQQGIANAASLPFPANIPAMASVAAATSGIVSTISGTQFGGARQYGGPVSADSLYRINEKGAPEMFTASNGSQYMLPTTNGQVTAADKIGGGAPSVNIVVNNTAPGTVASASYDDQSRTVSIAVTEVANQIRTNTGPVWSAMRGATNVQARM